MPMNKLNMSKQNQTLLLIYENYRPTGFKNKVLKRSTMQGFKWLIQGNEQHKGSTHQQPLYVHNS